MPWKEEKPMDQRVRVIGDWKSGHFSKVDLAKKYGVSRKTIIKWVQRYEAQGIDGLRELVRAPKNIPHRTDQKIIRALLEYKLKYRKKGPAMIHAELTRDYPHIAWPAASTIGYWLNKHGLVERRKKKRYVPEYKNHYQQCLEANDVWSIDYKGEFSTGNKKLCYPLTITDNYSRYIIRCKGLDRISYDGTRKELEGAFREYGLPRAIRSDNGVPFAGRGIGGLSRLSIWWIQLGILPERIKKGRPQQNGRHERMHKTLKYEVLDEVAYDIAGQQEEFNEFVYNFNERRPHQSLGKKTPSEKYRRSKREYVEKPAKPEYDYDKKVRKVRLSGEIKFAGGEYYLAKILSGQPIGLKQVEEGEWEIYYSFYKLGILNTNKKTIT